MSIFGGMASKVFYSLTHFKKCFPFCEDFFWVGYSPSEPVLSWFICNMPPTGSYVCMNICSSCCWRDCGTFRGWGLMGRRGPLWGTSSSFPLSSPLSCPSLPLLLCPYFLPFLFLSPRHGHMYLLFSSSLPVLSDCEEVKHPAHRLLLPWSHLLPWVPRYDAHMSP